MSDSQWQLIDEYGCDRCGRTVENGSGHYSDDETDDRICADCASLAAPIIYETIHSEASNRHNSTL
jgi:DNA-directed RNA polymerase subunit RPC12/RpoP